MKIRPEIRQRGFTLIELLVVIAIMAILAAFIFPVLGSMKRQQYLRVATGELAQIESALENYKNQYGVYPPSNPVNPLLNQLYYELAGVTNTTVNGVNSYQTLDGASAVSVSDYGNISLFDVGGPLNCTKAGGDTESAKARSFLPALKQNRIGTITDFNGNAVSLLVTSVRGPDLYYLPLGPGTQDVNPFRYVYPGTNNPNSYDLWIDLRISGKTNRISNWSRTPQIL